MRILLSAGERKFLVETRALTVDRDGGEHMVGLSDEEAHEYLNLLLRNKNMSSAELERFERLEAKHEAVRLSTLAAEADARDASKH